MKSPFHFEMKEVELREIRDDEVLIRIKACGVCGHDLIMAAGTAADWQPFGHEISGMVEKAGLLVKNVIVGDKVVLASGTFDRYSKNTLNGRADLDNGGTTLWINAGEPMGFSEYMIVPMELCIRYDGISFIEAAMVEPMGVAVDLVSTADIKLNDDVLVVGLGPIGLMALKLAKAKGARKVYGAELSTAQARIDLAKHFGADDIILTDKVKLEDYKFARGGVDKVLITAPPKMISSAVPVCLIGGIIAFLGIEYGPGGIFSLDSNVFHVNKLQLRASFAPPCLNFPLCIEMIQSGMLDAKSLVSHTFGIDDVTSGIQAFMADKAAGIKAVMVND